MTGYRCRDQDGLHLETGVRTPVDNDAGSTIGDWPSIVSYPTSAMALAGTAETWVRLTFHDPDGNTAHAYRKLVAAPGAQPVNAHERSIKGHATGLDSTQMTDAVDSLNSHLAEIASLLEAITKIGNLE